MTANDTYFDLGAWQRPIDSRNDDAQLWFNRGLIWVYGFNHEEAVLCFERALEADPDCALAHWGIAYAIGPNYNKIWEFMRPREREHALRTAHHHLQTALALNLEVGLERALLEALQTRYPTDPETEDFGPFNDAFADAMRSVYEQFPDDLDVTSLLADALMERTPWQLWDMRTGLPIEEASTLEVQELLEDKFVNTPEAWTHPGLLHMYIHLMEMSPTPEVALRHGDHLTNLVPDSGHLTHMATHIDVLCGDYQNVIHRNRQAARVDRPFAALRGPEQFYTVYRIHNVHFVAYGAMFIAQKEVALAAAAELRELLPESVVAFLPDLFEAFWGMQTHVMVRFGMWQELLDAPLPEDRELFSFTTALMYYGRVVALANLGRAAEARVELELFFGAREAVQESRFMFKNPAAEILSIAGAMAEGEQRYKSGDIEEGLGFLAQATDLSDNLLYDEPWGWMQPPRHAHAALLLEQGRHCEAERLYRDDLGLNTTLGRPFQHPGNVWALHGLHECLVQRGAMDEAVHIKRQLDRVIARADVPVGASCFCRGVAAA
ncbi:MAG: tetratricopeptide repeat protein [Pseudomonadota bacterium]